jgi:biopolymer transport protein ExbB/TolQ
LGNLAWWGVIQAGWPVLTVLLCMSIFTIAVAWEKWKTFGRVQVNSGPFLESVRKAGDSAKIVSFCERSDQPLAYITRVIYKTVGKREDRERNLQRAIQQLVHQLEVRISVLGTIASVAPFVGLLGTVIGIIKSFRAVSMSSSGGAGLVALGIAEALVGTAGGLVVAIPAVLFYNYFVNKLRRLIQEWEIAGAEVIDLAQGAGS